ncbi:MAG: non-canonical purine NTP pyrophosphatase [Patescibacteria group bacterium]|jgi:XTP/dITP diphosphohydrolase
MKVLIATGNPAKIQAYTELLSGFNIDVETLSSLNIKESFEEMGQTFTENAQGKAIYYYQIAKIPTIAEDSGLEIDYLNGEPGVKSRRWLGYVMSDEEALRLLKEKIQDIPPKKRSAHFTAVTCLVKSVDEIYTVHHAIHGELTEKVHKYFRPGFPYRALFIEKTYKKYLQDLTEEEYKTIDSRRKNIEEIIKYL